jgi:TPR repeat protein
MKFSFKPVINLSFFVVLLSSPIFLASKGSAVFLLPEGREDPLKLGHFLHRYAPPLISIYEQIQVAKADANTEALLSVKETFHTLDESEENWQNLANRLKQEVKGDPVELWPGQSPQQCIGSVLFYPQELIGSDDSDLLCYPGLAASLAISASMGNPVAIYQLSRGYPNLARECRREPEDVDQDMEISAQDRKQSGVLKAAALQIFTQAAPTNKIAEFYVMSSAYFDEGRISAEQFAAYLKSIGLPQAYFILGRLYENRHLGAVEGSIQNHLNKLDEDQLAYRYYYQALQGGYQEASWGIYRLSNVLEITSQEINDLFEKGKGVGLFLAAEKEKKKQRTEEAKRLYKRSGNLGRLRSFIKLGDEILLDNVPSTDLEQEAIFYYLKADRPGYAEGSRIISGNPRLYSTCAQQVKFLMDMIKLKDLRGYGLALLCMGIKRYSLESFEPFSKSSLQRDFESLLLERGKVLKIVNSIGEST